MSLLDEIGGRDAVEVVVAGFYERVLADERLKPFFRGVSMARLQAMQVDVFCAVLAGRPQDYRGRDVRTAHAGLRIADADFDAVATHLVATLHAAGVADALIERVVGLVAPLRGEIVDRSAQVA
jgi:hemoglobin